MVGRGGGMVQVVMWVMGSDRWSFPGSLLTSCCVARFLTGRGRVPVLGPGVGDPCPKECKLLQPLRKTVWRFLKKLEIELPYDPAIPLPGIYPDKIMIQKDTCTPMFIAALFTIAKTCKQPKCPSTDEWIKKMWFYIYIYIYIYMMEYYSLYIYIYI